MEQPQESVYNLIPQPIVVQEKPPMYRSRHPGVVPAQKKSAATMGPACVPLNGTANFTKKVDRSLPSPQRFQYTETVPRRSPVPKRTEQPLMGLTTDKNFIVANAVETILSAPKKTAEAPTDYTQKANYGQVPRYLHRIRGELQAERDMVAGALERSQSTSEDHVRMLSEQERTEVLAGLRATREKLNKDYQTISFTLDTPAKRQRKERLEAQIDQVDQDIRKMSHNYLFVQEQF
eukprot:gnl/Trimastix_PCT/1156.p1 GENE.gnl/Trimastix_PCT/1156~~gnl/Trimastix_PCT/1156.p1  ORF type:complete len:248 (+),score=61.11 gnl/Trimastix_PCT/1156:41-745(+)